MTGAEIKEELPRGFPDACQALEKLTGVHWIAVDVVSASSDPAQESIEAVRMGVGGLTSPRFLLAVTEADAGPFAAKVAAVFGLTWLDVPSVLTETANIVISAILNKMRGAGQAMIVTAPESVRGTRGTLLPELLGSRGRGAVRVRFAAQGQLNARLDVITAWDP